MTKVWKRYFGQSTEDKLTCGYSQFLFLYYHYISLLKSFEDKR